MVMKKRTAKQKMMYYRGLVEHWVGAGLGSGQAYGEYMRARDVIPVEYRLRKTDFLREYRGFAGQKKRGELVKYVGKDKRPSGMLAGRTFTTIRSNVVFEARLQVTPIDIAVSKDWTVRLGFDEWNTIADIKRRFIEVIETPTAYQHVDEITIVNMYTGVIRL